VGIAPPSLQAPPASFVVMESKLVPPPSREGTIRRTALVNRLRVRRPAGATVLTAPPGYGKTTLLAEWARAADRPFAWVALDESDNDPVTFLTYLAVALDRVAPLDHSVFEALASPGASVNEVTARLGRSLASFDESLVLVLDDVHLLTDWECMAAVAALVEHLPNESQIALSGRADVPVPVARLRTEGRLMEVGTDEMRLSKREASALLRAAGVELPDDEIAELTNRTEGWPAGLYLAALSLRTTHSPTSAFRGDDRFVSDYFRSELLANLPPSRIEFLTRLSVLDRMCGALCDAVLDGSGSAIALEDLEQSNLFVIPLDHERRWYRFHHLFRDMLRDELERRELALIPTLNGRAADWCEQQGDIDAAIEYAHAAGDQDRFVRLVEAALLPTYWRGRYATVERWLARLDDSALLERYPAVAVYGAEFYALLGRAEHAERWRDAAERSTTDRPMPDGSPVTAWKALARAFAGQGGAVGMLDDAALAAATLAPTSPFRTNALIVLGTALMLAGNDARADSVLAEATEAGSSSGAIPGVSLSLAQRSLLAIGRDDWPAAHALVAQAREVMRTGQLEDYVTSAFTYAAAARAALRHSDWARAHEELERAERLTQRLTYVLPHLAVQARLELARAYLALGESIRARELMAEVDAILARRPDLGVLNEHAEALGQELDRKRHAKTGWESSLTASELRLLPLLTTHLSFREIAERLHVSRNTVKTQAISAYRKLGVSSRSDAIERAVTLGLVDPSRALERDA
jgi:LuxR family maltose regulon positive regulatory protein